MTTTIATLSTAAEAITGLASLAFGALGGVVLGDFSFAGFEVPEQITFGTHQQMTVHKLPGGERVIDLMGPDPIDISWSGTIIDGRPYERAKQLNQMAADGDPLPLIWGPFFYTVFIREFSGDTRYSQVPYRVSCTILKDEGASSAGDDPDVTSSVNDDITQALGVSPAAMSAVLTKAQQAVAIAGPLIPGSTAAFTALNALTTAQTSLTAFQGISNLNLSSISLTSAAGIQSAATQAQGLAGSLYSGAYLGRAIRNLS